MKYTIKYNNHPLCVVHLEDTDQIHEAIERLLEERGLCGYFDKRNMFFRVLAEYIHRHGWLPNLRKDSPWDNLYNITGIKIEMLPEEEFDFGKVQIEDEFIFSQEPSKI